MKTPKPGTISWTDLTVPDATAVSQFYSAVVGWKVMPVPMGGYDDYCMLPPAGRQPAAGICQARGVNKDIPPQWLVYITVADLARSLRACKKSGGKVIAPTRKMGAAKMAIIQDPAGAIAALYQPAPAPKK